jgi:hypothetical protein
MTHQDQSQPFTVLGDEVWCEVLLQLGYLLHLDSRLSGAENQVG